MSSLGLPTTLVVQVEQSVGCVYARADNNEATSDHIWHAFILVLIPYLGQV